MTKAEIKTNGLVYEGWKQVTVRRSIEAVSSVFSFQFTDSWTPNREPWGLNPQDAVNISLGGKSLITGYAETLNAKLDSERSYTIAGRDRSCDVVDCSAAVKQYKRISLVDLCNAIALPVGVEFALGSPSVNNSIFDLWTVSAGETMLESIDRALRMRGVLCVPDGSGNLTLTYAGSSSASAKLIEGKNCKSMGYVLDYSKRFSDYTVKGQDKSADGFFGVATSVQGTSTDAGVKRNRPMIIQAEKKVTNAEAKTRAAWEANVRAARSTVATVLVQDWEQSPGILWSINQRVTYEAKNLGLSGSFIISEIEYTQDDRGGTTASLTLMPPDAFLSDPNVKKKQSDQTAKGFTFP